MRVTAPGGRALGIAEIRRRLGARWNRRGRWTEDACALAIYLAAWVGLIGRFAVADPAHTCACQGTADPAIFMWSFVWWPHAILNGLNPFVSHVVWTPEGGNVGASALVPVLGLILWPITAAFGPIASYNAASLLGPVLAAWLTFRLCRYLTGRWLPSLTGGYIFGFSSYVLAHMLGQLHLMLIFLLPAAVHLVLLWLDERISARRFVILMCGLITLQFLLSVEVLVTMLGFGAVALLLGYLFSPPRRRHILEMLPKVLLAGAVSAVLLSPYLYYAVKGLNTNSSTTWPVVANTFSADPLNYVLPTPVTWIGHGLTDSVAAKFISTDGGAHGKYNESAAYLGLPLLLLVGLFLLTNRRRPAAKVMLGVLVIAFVASLGPHLHVSNPPRVNDFLYEPSIPLPWRAVSTLPVLDHVLPARLSVYVFLVAAVAVALWLSKPARRTWPKWLLAAVGVLALLPNQALPYWGKPVNPSFFTRQTYKHYLTRDEIALVLPYGWTGNSMLWQAETGMYFRMASGYLSPEIPDDYWREPVVRALLDPEAEGKITPQRFRFPLGDFIARRRVGAVIVGPGTPGPWRRVISSLGLRPQHVGGVLVYALSRRPRRLERAVRVEPVDVLRHRPLAVRASHRRLPRAAPEFR